MADSTQNSQLKTPNSKLSTPLDPGLLVALLLALFAVVPLLSHAGLPNTADGPAHLMRQAELNRAWQDGLLYPRWAPDLAYGYGLPLFHYAPPLLYHATQTIHLSGLPLDASMKGTLILMMFLYSVGMYLFARDLFGPRAGLLAAAVYLYAPYRLREAYVQGNYGQFCGLAFYPLILWSFHGLITTKRRRYVPLAALSLAGLLLSHNISAMIFAPVLGAYILFLMVLEFGRLEGWKAGRLEDRKAEPTFQPSNLPAFQSPREASNLLPTLILALALGLGLSAFFWLPAFGERDMIHLAGITRGFFDFRRNFIGLGELLALPRPLDLAAINPYYPLSLGLAQMVFAALGVIGLVLYYLSRFIGSASFRTSYVLRFTHHASRITHHVLPHAAFFAAGLLLSAFLALPVSQPVWEAVPLLELAEFPWRWLGPAVLCAAVLAGAALYVVEGLAAGSWRLKVGGWGLGMGLAFTLAANLVYLFPAQFIPWGTPGPADALAYEVETGAIGTTSAGEFLPRWTNEYPSPEVLGPDYAAGRLPAALDPASLPPGATAATLARTARETRLAVSSPAPFTATFRALYWPSWRVIVQRLAANGTATAPNRFVAEPQITQPEGLMRARLPAGDYQVSLRLFPTPLRRAATVISAASLVALIGTILKGWKDGRLDGWMVGRLVNWKIGKLVNWGIGRPAELPNLPIYQSTNLPISHSLLLSAALLAGLLITRPMADWFRVQSPPDRVLGAQYAVQVDLSDQVRLLAYDLPVEGWKVGRLEGWFSLPAFQPSSLPAFQPSSLPTFQSRAGDALPVVLYWRALAPLDRNYSVFVHLDGPQGQTYASADEVNPEDIPTSRWPPSLYVRNPLTLALPADLPPIRYTLTAGLYDSQSGERLPVTGCLACSPGNALPLASVWVTPRQPLDEGDVPHRLGYRLGEQIELLGYEVAAGEPATLTLYWRTAAPVEKSYTVFIHALGADGQVMAQFDAPPFKGLYPSDAWLPGQIIADAHTLALPPAAQTLAVGLYDPATLARQPVRDPAGQPVSQDAIRLQVAGIRESGN